MVVSAGSEAEDASDTNSIAEDATVLKLKLDTDILPK